MKKDELLISGESKISDFPPKFNRLVGIVENLIQAVSLLFGIIAGFVAMRILPTDLLVRVFSSLNISWNQLSEGYQLLILGVPLTIFAMIVGHFINRKFIDPLLEKSK